MQVTESGPPARSALAARLRAHPGTKLAVWLGLAVGICVPYFGIQTLAWLPAHELPATPIDRLVPFDPAWVWLYASLALLVPLAPLLAETRDQLRRYAIGLAWLCVPCFLVFLLVPVAGPRPDIHPSTGLYAWMVSVDRPSNSLPSLHAGLTAYSMLYIDQVLGRRLTPRGRAVACGLGGVWGGLILYSTLATRQHWLLDLTPGLLIAWAAHRLAWRRPGGEAPLSR